MIDDDNTPDIGTVDDDVTDFEQFAVIDDPVTDTEYDDEQQKEADTDTDLPEGEQLESDAEDADEDDEAEAQAEAEEETDAEEDDEDTDDPKPLEDSVTIKMDDGEQITLAELKKGYLRQSDYTRKRQEESQIAQRANQLQHYYAQELQRTQMAMQAFMPKPPDKSLLDYGQDGEYLRQKEDFDQAQKYLAYMQAEQQKLAQEQQQKQQYERQNMVAQERQRLLESMPELKSEPARQKMQAELAEAVKSFGFEPDELENVYDHRVIKALIYANKALQAEKSQADVKKKVTAKAEKAKPVSQPKRTRKSTRNTDSKQLLKLANDGNERAADALFEQFV
jgi:hypothetical protein